MGHPGFYARATMNIHIETDIMHIAGEVHQIFRDRTVYLCELPLAFVGRLCYTISNKNKRRFLPWLTLKK